MSLKNYSYLTNLRFNLKKKFEVKLLDKARLILDILVKRDMKCKILYLNYMHFI